MSSNPDMDSTPERMATTNQSTTTEARPAGILIVLAISVLIALLYVPFLYWLGWMTVHTQQLLNGALLVVFALAICVRDAVGRLRFSPEFRNQGIWLIGLALLCLWLAGRWKVALLPLVLSSACLSFAGVCSFLLGDTGVREFLPAVSAFFVFGALVGLVPSLDWPLRAMAGRYAGAFLAAFGEPVKLALVNGEPARLLLSVNGHPFEVATECNGFGLLTSSLIIATTLVFLYRLPWLDKLAVWALSVPIAIGFNFLRIVSICVVAPRTALPYHFVHETLGLIFYFTGLGLVWRIAKRFKTQIAAAKKASATP